MSITASRLYITLVGIATACLISIPAAAPAATFGTDTRALHFLYSSGFQYTGGYLDDFNEYDVLPDGETSSLLSTTFNGTHPVAPGIDDPVSVYHFASANLATGKLKAYATDPVFYTAEGSPVFSQGRSNASFADTLSFTFAPTVTDAYVKIGLRTKIDGTYASNGPGASGSMSTELRASTDQFSYQYGGFQQNYWGGGSPDYTATNMTAYGDSVFGYDITVATTPFNLTLLNLLSVNAYGSTVDYSHTATFGFVLPDGVQYTSASGVFLSDDGIGAVPEPASWAMLIVGFGITGGALRRRPLRAAAMA